MKYRDLTWGILIVILVIEFISLALFIGQRSGPMLCTIGKCMSVPFRRYVSSELGLSEVVAEYNNHYLRIVYSFGRPAEIAFGSKGFTAILPIPGMHFASSKVVLVSQSVPAEKFLGCSQAPRSFINSYQQYYKNLHLSRYSDGLCTYEYVVDKFNRITNTIIDKHGLYTVPLSVK